MTDTPLLPSERAAKQADLKKKHDEHQERVIAALREDFGKTFQTDHGQRVLAWIMDRSNFGRVILSATSEHGVDEKMTTFAAMELNFYLAIRKYIKADILANVEYGSVKPSGHIDPEEDVKRPTSKTTSKKKKI